MLKIAHVSPYDYLAYGGVNNHIRYLVQALRRRGWDAWVVATLPPKACPPPHLLRLMGRPRTISSGGAQARVNLNPLVFAQARQLLRRQHFDIVHLHNPLSPLVSLSFLYHRASAPHTVFVATFHEYRSHPNPAIEVGKPLFRRWINRLDGRITVSAAALTFNQPLFPGDYQVIPNGVDVARFANRGVEGPPRRTSARPTLLFVGRLEARKGFWYLLRAFELVKRQMPTVQLWVVGGFTQRESAPYVDYVRAHRIEGVTFIGPVSDTALPTFYQAADLFCAPSVDFESFGIVLLEAMASGMPIVAADLPGYRSVIEAGRQGLFVPPENPVALATAILELLHDPQRRAAMSGAGRLRAQAFDWEIISERMSEFYAGVLAKMRGHSGSRDRTAA